MGKRTPAKKRTTNHSTVGDAIIAVSRDNSGWIRTLVGTLVVGGFQTGYHYHSVSIANDGKDSMRSYHMQDAIQRHKSDSLCAVQRDSVNRTEEAKRDTALKQFEDSVYHIFQRHVH